MGGCKGAGRISLDGVQLRRREALVRLLRSVLWPEGGNPVRTWTLLPVSLLLRPGLRKPEGKRDVQGTPQSAIHTGASWREREHDGAIPREAQGDALEHL